MTDYNTLIRQLDDIISSYEAEWGAGNLPRLCTHDTALKWQKHLEKLNDAISNNSTYELGVLVEGTKRAFARMEQEAIKNGYTKACDVFFYESDNQSYAIVKSYQDTFTATKRYPDKEVVSIQELINLLESEKDKVFNDFNPESTKKKVERFSFNWEHGDGLPI